MSVVIQVTWVFSTLPLLLNWLNQHRITLLTKGSLPHAQWKLHLTVTLDLLSANEMNSAFSCMLATVLTLVVAVLIIAERVCACTWRMCKNKHTGMFQKTFWVHEHVTANSTSIFLFSWKWCLKAMGVHHFGAQECRTT